mgnify:CR=1 FL=1
MDIRTFAKEHFEEYKALICQLTAIPAPSHHEERRAAFICEYLHQLGYDQAFIDDAKNVICEVKGSDLEASYWCLSYKNHESYDYFLLGTL